ncbi:MAG: sulfotransferase [Planctomycetales bacterium]|nr:sulfotransferase [Planctomycetales bacterium]MCA9167042.1 sulfotransferase [Planctomycetales bacterium]
MRLKHRWSLGHNYLAGITAGDWLRLLRANRFAVSPAYWHRALFISATSLVNSYYRYFENRQYHAEIEATQLDTPPLFILGHWRSGTTLLHYLLAQDTDNFSFANTYQVVNPYTFLTTEATMSRRFAHLVPPTRPMDDMQQSFTTPQEDEFAPLLLTFCSLYLGISFPQREKFYSRYLTFRGVSGSERERWKRQFLWFCKKLTLRNPKRLLLKSPAHTARIRLLLEVFPDARFVHIHRDPYRVFQSQRHFFDTAGWYTYLQKPNLDRIDDGILERYQQMYDAYFEDLSRIPQGHFCEVSFRELEDDPLRTVRDIYEQLALPGFESFEPKLRAYVDSLAGYRKNTFAPLDPATQQKVADHWSRYFEAWGYHK